MQIILSRRNSSDSSSVNSSPTKDTTRTTTQQVQDRPRQVVELEPRHLIKHSRFATQRVFIVWFAMKSISIFMNVETFKDKLILIVKV